MTTAARSLVWAHLGRVAYGPAYALQKRLREAIRQGAGGEHLLTLEHDPPVFTLGRNASPADVTAAETWRQARGIEVHESDRGGKVTYHGPGQLVAYPIIDLDPDRRDVRRYVGDLEHIIIAVLAEVGVEAWVRTGKDFVGVWTGPRSAPRKIASIGVHLARWITIHGLALNLTTELDHFGGIVACGLGGVTMTSVAVETGVQHSIEPLAARLAHHASAIFARRLVVADAAAVARLRACGDRARPA